MVKHKSIIHILAMVAIVCFDRPLPAVEFEMKGIMQYDVSDSVIPVWLNHVDNCGLFRYSLYKVWERSVGVDADVTIQNLDDGKTYIYNLRREKRFDLPQGAYRITCDKYDVSVVERRRELDCVINREAVFYSYLRGSGCLGYNGCRKLEVLFYPKNSSITVRGRVVDNNGTPIKGIEIWGEPVLNSDAYYYNTKKSDGSSTDKTLTNTSGEFVFENQPPAAVELGVYYLLTGKRTKPMQCEGEVVFDFDIQVPGYYPCGSFGCRKEYYKKIPLISAANLTALRKVAEKLRSAMPEEARQQLDKMRKDPIVLPVSTNNVIYVGDIVVYKDKEK